MQVVVVSDGIANPEARLQFNKIMLYHQSHKDGFGSISIPEISIKNSQAYQKLLSTVQEADKQKLLACAVQLKLQGQWTKQCSFVWMYLSWKSYLSMPPSLLSFCLGLTYNTIPWHSNPHRWNISTDTTCQLCHKQICTTTHSWSL